MSDEPGESANEPSQRLPRLLRAARGLAQGLIRSLSISPLAQHLAAEHLPEGNEGDPHGGSRTVASRLSRFLAELKRRRVYRVAATYVVVGLGVLGAAELILDPLGLGAARTFIVVLVLLGFPVALGLAWAYEVRPEEPMGARDTAPAPPVPISDRSEADGRASIVVLPFDNMSPDPGDAYFADGLTEEIITDLSHVRSLRVISRNSAFALKGSPRTTRAIARELDVQYVLEGSVRKAGDDLRITAQLIDAAGDAHLWAERYSGTFGDVFAIQEQVARAIVGALQIELTAEERQSIAKRPIENVQAYESYLKATAATYRITEEGMAEALRHFRFALGTVGDNALLHAGVAYIHFFLMNIGVAIEENRTKAMESVRKALALDPEMPKARALLGWLTMFYRGNLDDVKEGARHLRRALESDPDEFQALWGMTVVYLYVGRVSAAYPLARRMRRIAPLDPLSLWILGGVYFNDARYDLALRHFQELHEVDPAHPWWRAWYAWMLAYDGHVDEAATLLAEGGRANPADMHTRLARMQIHGLRRDEQAARNELEGEFREWCWRERAWSACIATALALLGAKDEALDWLEHAVDSGFVNYPLFSKGDPGLESVRGEARFERLMERVKHAWEGIEI
jgi:TolB-like protein